MVSVEPTPETLDSLSRRPHHRARVRLLVGLAFLAVLALVTFSWWSGTGGHLQPGGNGVTATYLVVGVPTYVGYDLDAQGGDVHVDGVHLEHASSGVDASFFVATGYCPIGTTGSVPDTCALQPVEHAVVHPGRPRLLVASYTLTSSGQADAGDVIVNYQSDLHQRSGRVGPTVCLSTGPIAFCPSTPRS
jgi:hypothetical protein